MNTDGLARHYASLTPQERFRLILAAGARGDQAEQWRLVAASGRIALLLRDHALHVHAFIELAVWVFLELMEEAARYADAFHHLRGDEPWEEPDDDETEGADTEDAAEGGAGEEGWAPWERRFHLALAAGFVLKTKAEGWKLFCERLSIPPFAAWEGLPGFGRLRRALALAEGAAVVPEVFLRWLNQIRPAGAAELTEVPLTPERVADENAQIYQDRVAWWGGRS
jgi:hypothetical protein